jgi:hypothetical protein
MAVAPTDFKISDAYDRLGSSLVARWDDEEQAFREPSPGSHLGRKPAWRSRYPASQCRWGVQGALPMTWRFGGDVGMDSLGWCAVELSEQGPRGTHDR